MRIITVKVIMSKENCGSHNLHKLRYSIQAFQTEDIQPPKCRFAALAPGDDEKNQNFHFHFICISV